MWGVCWECGHCSMHLLNFVCLRCILEWSPCWTEAERKLTGWRRRPRVPDYCDHSQCWEASFGLCDQISDSFLVLFNVYDQRKLGWCVRPENPAMCVALGLWWLSTCFMWAVVLGVLQPVFFSMCA